MKSVTEVAVTFTLCLLGMAAEHVSHELLHLHFIPEGGTAIILGFIIGLFDDISGENLEELTRFEPKLFEFGLLPFVIFSAGFSLRKRGLFENFGTILTYAVIGTLVSVTVVSYGIYHGFKEKYNIYECFMFGSLISAVDPVATLAVMSSVFKVDERVKPPTVYSVVFGESILNDAVAIVLFKTFEHFYAQDAPADFSKEIPSIFAKFLAIFIVSILLGFLFGLFSALSFKYLKLDGYLVWEFMGTLLIAYCSYITSFVAGFSGLITIFFCGVTMSDYTWQNFSEIGKMTVYRCIHAVGYAAETMIFVYLGLAVFQFKHDFDAKMIFVTLGLCLAGRTISIFGLTPLLNLRRSRKIVFREQIVMWISGLRGAIAFALAVELGEITQHGIDQAVGGDPHGNGPDEGIQVEPGSHDHVYSSTDLKAAKQFVTTTLMIVIFTTFVFGGLTAPLMKCLDVKSDPDITTTQENHQVPGGLLGFVQRINQLIKKWVIREHSQDEMAFEGRLGLRLDRLAGAKKIDTLDVYFKAFYDKHMKDMNGEERARLMSDLDSYNRDSARATAKSPVEIMKEHSQMARGVAGALSASPLAYTPPFISSQAKSDPTGRRRKKDDFKVPLLPMDTLEEPVGLQIVPVAPPPANLALQRVMSGLATPEAEGSPELIHVTKLQVQNDTGVRERSGSKI